MVALGIDREVSKTLAMTLCMITGYLAAYNNWTVSVCTKCSHFLWKLKDFPALQVHRQYFMTFKTSLMALSGDMCLILALP